MEPLNEKLTDKETHPGIQTLLLQRLHQWRYQLPFTNEAIDPSLLDIVIRQDLIGWKNLVEGLPTLAWQQQQQQYYSSIGSTKTGKRRIISVLALLNNIAWDQWDHRNHISHNVKLPRHKKAKTILHKCITEEFL